MASVDELSYKVERANQWKEDVEAEIEQVTAILKMVGEEVETQPYEDDTIMVGLKEMGHALQVTFDTLNKNFTEAVSRITEITDEWKKTISNILAALAENVKKFGGTK